MSEYYGVTTPTDDFLAHWGVKGMKWGIRKARPVSNGAPKSFGYRRAERKLAKLEAKANRNALLAKADRLDKVSRGARIAGRVGLGAAAAGTGASVAASKIHLPGIKNKYLQGIAGRKGNTLTGAYAEATKELKNIENLRKTARGADLQSLNHRKAYFEKQLADSKNRIDEFTKDTSKKMNDVTKARGIARSAQAAGAGLAALGYGAAIGSKLRANALRKTANNSAKMAAARQRAAEFRKQMNTKYGVQTKSKKRK